MPIMNLTSGKASQFSQLNRECLVNEACNGLLRMVRKTTIYSKFINLKHSKTKNFYMCHSSRPIALFQSNLRVRLKIKNRNSWHKMFECCFWPPMRDNKKMKGSPQKARLLRETPLINIRIISPLNRPSIFDVIKAHQVR